MHGALFVPHQDVLHHVLLKQRVIDRQHGAARITENVLDALIGERLDHHVGAGHLGARLGTGRFGFNDGFAHDLLRFSLPHPSVKLEFG
jgi:hypothetical protein